MARHFLRKKVARKTPVGLSDAEFQCLKLRSTGLHPKEMGAELHLSASTINTYLCRAVKKLGTDTIERAIWKAMALGLIPCPCGCRGREETKEIQRAVQLARGLDDLLKTVGVQIEAAV